MSIRGVVRYVICILMATLIEAVALAAYLPALAEDMMRHSGPAQPGVLGAYSRGYAFVLHLPTILLTYPFGDLILLTPLTQIVFWACLFIYISRKLGLK